MKTDDKNFSLVSGTNISVTFSSHSDISLLRCERAGAGAVYGGNNLGSRALPYFASFHTCYHYKWPTLGTKQLNDIAQRQIAMSNTQDKYLPKTNRND